MEKKQIEVLENGNVRVTIPLIFKIAGGRTRIFTPDSEHVEYTPIQLALARAFRWQKMIDEGKFSNIKDLAATVGVDSGLISRSIFLFFRKILSTSKWRIFRVSKGGAFSLLEKFSGRNWNFILTQKRV